MNRRRRIPLTPVLALAAITATVVLARAVPTDHGYTVELGHASGLSAGDEVRVAGIQVGSVDEVHLEGTKVVARFAADTDVVLTRDSRAAVKLSSLLGQRYLEVRPGTAGRLRPGGTIPVDQTEPAYTLDRFFLDSGDELAEFDLGALERAIDVLATDLAGSPEATTAALEGVGTLSALVATRDRQLDRLLGTTREVTDVIRGQQDELLDLVSDADLVMQMVHERRAAIRRLLGDTQVLVREVGALVDRNQRHLRPMLLQLRTLLGVLEENKAELDETLELTGPMMRYYANASGDGPWVSVYAPYFLIPDNIACPLFTPEKCR
jgi:phospholipid/cholesterol/gamma-HCH transport system substrate-binding protein